MDAYERLLGEAMEGDPTLSRARTPSRPRGRSCSRSSGRSRRCTSRVRQLGHRRPTRSPPSSVDGTARHESDRVLLDVDNTLIDNDRIAADLKRYLTRRVGAERQERYWAIFASRLRAELGYADYLGALQRYRVENPREPHLLAVSSFLVNYPFANRLLPRVTRPSSSTSAPGVRR